MVLVMLVGIVLLIAYVKNSPKAESVDVESEIIEEKEVLPQKEQNTETDIQTNVQKKGVLIAIDPGHQGESVDMSGLEENAPNSSVLKVQATCGTRGTFSGIPEYQLNLDIALALRDALEMQGYDVIMTRENNETAISNKERALLANDAGADLVIRIHANGSESTSANGALVLIGSTENPYVGNLYEESYRAGEMILNAYCDATGMVNRGVQINDTMTGINWSKVPVLILEMGFMTNEQDDLNMADSTYRTNMVSGIVEGINQYFAPNLNELEEQIQSVIQTQETIVSVYVEDLSSNACLAVNDRQMQSASLIKLFVAGCVYEHLQEVQAFEQYKGETQDLLKNMISASGNDATNKLIGRLGQGDTSVGMDLVNQFCQTHLFTQTKLGRLMLDFDSEEDNYTSVKDCANLLKAMYQQEIMGSEDILEFMKNQERQTKIPAGIQEPITIANKTGELEEVENDVAIVYLDGRPYIICVMMEQLQDVASGRNTIVQISSIVYQYMRQLSDMGLAG